MAMMLRKSNFENYLDEATSSFRLETDWELIMKLCDLIRQGDVKPTAALNAIQKKISNPNSVVAMFGLTNCGALIQDEISTKQFMETFKDIIKTCANETVKTKCLDLLQSWAFAFRSNPKHRAVQDTVTIMKTEGYKFPALKESDAMFVADTAPSWKDGDRCHRCRSSFSLMNRKHHCRACGEVFCQQCSQHNITLPKFGIEKPVRVCDTCWEQSKNNSHNQNDSVNVSLQKGRRRPHKSRKSSPWSKTSTLNKPGSSLKTEELPAEYLASSLSQQSQVQPNKKTEEELKEEEDLQLALALSQSEAESKKSTYRPVIRSKSFSPPISSHQKNIQYENEDYELSRYLNRSYWENRAVNNDKPREIDEKMLENKTSHNFDIMRDKTEENGMDSENEVDLFANALRDQLEIFVNRMKSNSSRGRSITNDTSVQSLFMNITTLHSKLLRYIQEHDDNRVYYEGLQDKLTQVKDARAALDALREEHRERLRKEAEIAERQRQMQMAQKLEIMRQKKQEYLQYQRQLALKRIHDQERELHMRQEQQKQQYLLTNAYGSLPYIPQQGGGISAFEPVSSMGGMNMNNLPSGPVSAGHFAPQSSFQNHYSQGQNVGSVGPPQQQLPSSAVMMAQNPIGPPNAYAPVNPPSTMPPTNQSNVPPHNQMVPNQPSTTQYPGNQPVIHPSGHMNAHIPPQQAVYLDHQNPQQMGVYMEQNMHVMGPPGASNRVEQPNHLMGPPQAHNGPQQMPNVGIMQHPSVGRSMIPPSSSPLSSPSSSSEHSLIQHGPQPIPSAPSATSTPQPEEKEEVAELISFD